MRLETTLLLDQKSSEVVSDLRETLNAKSNIEVIKRAITLLRLAADTASDKGHVILRSADGTEREVVMA